MTTETQNQTEGSREDARRPSTAPCYEGDFGHTFHFNSPVIAEFCPGQECERTGRLVQVRKKAGAWGSDMYFIRRNDGSLMTFENVSLREFAGDVAEPFDCDAIDVEYTVKGEYPETGFVIEEPCGPPAQHQAFAITVTSS